MARTWINMAKAPQLRDGEQLLGRFRSSNAALYVTDQRILVMRLGGELSIP
jgi:hypothetical protein